MLSQAVDVFAVGDGEPCLTAGKPQSGAACGKVALYNNVPRMWHNIVRHLRRRIMERYPRFRRLRFAPPAVMHGQAPSALSTI